MTESKKVLLVDDQAGEIRWLIRRLVYRGYQVVLATNEEDANAAIDRIAEDSRAFAAGIFDIMVATMDLGRLIEMGEEINLESDVFEPSINTGVRLCRRVRETPALQQADFPIAALSVRADDTLKEDLDALDVTLYDRTAEDGSGHSIMRFLDRHLPPLPESEASQLN